MNSSQKIVLFIGLVLIIIVFIVWLTGGSEIFTKTQVYVEKTSELDQLLGLEPKKELQDTFIFGLVPPGLSFTAELISASTVAGLIAVISAALFFFFRIKKQKETTV